jgi:predicted phage tail protein
MFLEIAEIILSALVFFTFITQIIVPIWRNTVLFPAFRTKRKELERQLAEAKEQIAMAEEEKRLRKLQKSAKEMAEVEEAVEEVS